MEVPVKLYLKQPKMVMLASNRSRQDIFLLEVILIKLAIKSSFANAQGFRSLAAVAFIFLEGLFDEELLGLFNRRNRSRIEKLNKVFLFLLPFLGDIGFRIRLYTDVFFCGIINVDIQVRHTAVLHFILDVLRQGF